MKKMSIRMVLSIILTLQLMFTSGGIAIIETSYAESGNISSNSDLEFQSGYPIISKNTETSINLTAKTTKPCTVYYFIFPESSEKSVGDSYKSVDALTNYQQNYSYYANVTGAIYSKFDINQDNINNNKEVYTTISGLKCSLTTNYTVYVALKDQQGLQISQPVKLILTIYPDIPSITGITASNITENSIDISVNVNKPCTLYYYMQSKPSASDLIITPDKNDIVNDNNTNITKQSVTDSTKSTKPINVTISKDCNGCKLIRNCNYYVYVCGKDSNGYITPVKDASTDGNNSSIIAKTLTSINLKRICNEKAPDIIQDIGLCRYAMNSNQYVWINSGGNYGTTNIRTIDDGTAMPDGTGKTASTAINIPANAKGYTINESYSSIGAVYGNASDTSNTNNGASVIWAGQIQPLYTGNHTFTLNTSGDAGKVFIKYNDSYQQIIPNNSSMTSNAIKLTAGQLYPIIVHYACNNATASKQCILTWACPNTSIAAGAPITSDRFFPILDTTIFRTIDTTVHPSFTSGGGSYTMNNYYPPLPHEVLKSKDSTLGEYQNSSSIATQSIGGLNYTTATIVNNTGKGLGNTKIITATATPNNTTFSGIQCITSDPTKVTVDCDGKTIRGVNSGTGTVISVLSGDGVKSDSTCAVNVIDPFKITNIKILTDIDYKNVEIYNTIIKVKMNSYSYSNNKTPSGKFAYIGVKVSPDSYYDVGDYSTLSIINKYNSNLSFDKTDRGSPDYGEGVEGSGLKGSLDVSQDGIGSSDRYGKYNNIKLNTDHTYYVYSRYHDVTFTVTDCNGQSKSDKVTIKTYNYLD